MISECYFEVQNRGNKFERKEKWISESYLEVQNRGIEFQKREMNFRKLIGISE